MDTYHLYIGDCASTLRSNLYRDYEKYPYGTLEGNCQPRKSYYAALQGKMNIFSPSIVVLFHSCSILSAVR